SLSLLIFFFLHATPTSEIYSLSLHDALPISNLLFGPGFLHHRPNCALALSVPEKAAPARLPCRRKPIYPSGPGGKLLPSSCQARSEEHTSELQSLTNLVCRLLLEKKKQPPAL